MKTKDGALTDAQLRVELNRCEYCEKKPCREACPADCSPADFIMAARVGAASDYRRAGALIMGSNPLGWVCGVVCPDYFCMKACSRGAFDEPINIPAVQAGVMKRAYAAGLRSFPAPEANGLALAGTETHPIPGGIETTMRFAARKPGPLGLVALAVRLPKNVDARILSLAPFGPAAFADFSKQISEDGRFAFFQGTLGEETNVQFALSVSGPAVANVRGTSGIGAFQLSIQPTKASVTGK